MISMILKMKIPIKERKSLTLYLPLFLVWLFLLPLFLLMLPFVLIGAIFLWVGGYGCLAFRFYPMLFSILGNLRGLSVTAEVKNFYMDITFI